MNATATMAPADRAGGPQYMRALERANQVRLARASLKRRIALGETRVAAVILECPWEAESMAVGRPAHEPASLGSDALPQIPRPARDVREEDRRIDDRPSAPHARRDAHRRHDRLRGRRGRRCGGRRGRAVPAPAARRPESGSGSGSGSGRRARGRGPAVRGDLSAPCSTRAPRNGAQSLIGSEPGPRVRRAAPRLRDSRRRASPATTRRASRSAQAAVAPPTRHSRLRRDRAPASARTCGGPDRAASPPTARVRDARARRAQPRAGADPACGRPAGRAPAPAPQASAGADRRAPRLGRRDHRAERHAESGRKGSSGEWSAGGKICGNPPATIAELSCSSLAICPLRASRTSRSACSLAAMYVRRGDGASHRGGDDSAGIGIGLARRVPRPRSHSRSSSRSINRPGLSHTVSSS